MTQMMLMMQGMGAGGPVMEKVMRMVMQMSNPLMGMMKEVMEIIPGPGNGCKMARAGFLESYAFGPSGFWDYGSATLCCKI